MEDVNGWMDYLVAGKGARNKKFRKQLYQDCTLATLRPEFTGIFSDLINLSKI